MRKINFAGLLFIISLGVLSASADQKAVNPKIDAAGFMRITVDGIKLRESRLIDELTFIEFAKDKNTLILDTRSAEKFAKAHVAGAVNLNFSDLTKDSLMRVIPSKNTRILIYCNNNFDKSAEYFAPARDPFPSKTAGMALNLSTYVALYSYGYENVFELRDLLTIESARIRLEGKSVPINEGRVGSS